ncbi:acetyl-coenzyme A carboxylase carboxyl transferase subunit alpha [Spirochaetota bacterium]|nr:acetyl-coenzyme A carboxylase carboxyl transferase subunit alpha [Spirochaetota bacterium]
MNTGTVTSESFPDLLEFEKKDLGLLHKKMTAIMQKKSASDKDLEKLKEFELEFQTKAKSLYKKLDNWQRTQVARHPQRPYTLDYLSHIFDDFQEFSGDRLFGDDRSVIGGIASLEGRSVVIVGQQKGRSTEENIKRNFGMPHPEGYRKALKLFRLADKFNKPIVTFIDTPGAYPGIGAEERGQAEAIAKNLQEMFTLRVPIVSVVIGEGGSGGALALSVCNHLMMLENSIYSVISPESCAAILWKDEGYKRDAAMALKNDAFTGKSLKVVDEIIKEAPGGAHRGLTMTSSHIKAALSKSLGVFSTYAPEKLISHRIEKFANIGILNKAS